MNKRVIKNQASPFRMGKTDGTHHDTGEAYVPSFSMAKSVYEYVGELLQDCSVECRDFDIGFNTKQLGIIVCYGDCHFFITQYLDNGQEILLDGTDTVPYEIMEFCNELRTCIAEGVIQSILSDKDYE